MIGMREFIKKQFFFYLLRFDISHTKTKIKNIGRD